mmetsp:Transcript_9367/g.24194  ORF Transcript_9367/g.24194 Transcript_9367/m.24194 type:complete len:262 (-) Transcript_9367:1768-2553(-)
MSRTSSCIPTRPTTGPSDRRCTRGSSACCTQPPRSCPVGRTPGLHGGAHAAPHGCAACCRLRKTRNSHPTPPTAPSSSPGRHTLSTGMFSPLRGLQCTGHEQSGGAACGELWNLPRTPESMATTPSMGTARTRYHPRIAPGRRAPSRAWLLDSLARSTSYLLGAQSACGISGPHKSRCRPTTLTIRSAGREEDDGSPDRTHGSLWCRSCNIRFPQVASRWCAAGTPAWHHWCSRSTPASETWCTHSRSRCRAVCCKGLSAA